MGGDFTAEKLRTAALILEASPDTLRKRLEEAYLSALIHLDHPMANFPQAEVRKRFLDLMAELAPAGHVAAALDIMSEHDQRRIAGGILEVCEGKRLELGQTNPSGVAGLAAWL